MSLSQIISNHIAQQREDIISIALNSAEGRSALAAAMVESIKTSLMYQSIGRKLLMVDSLPQSTFPIYQHDVAVQSYVMTPKNVFVPSHIKILGKRKRKVVNYSNISINGMNYNAVILGNL